MKKRVFLIVADSFGIGETPDADLFNDCGSNTLKAISKSRYFNIPTLISLGIGNIDGVDYLPKNTIPLGVYGKAAEKSKGKDTVTGHWEIAGLISDKPMPLYPNGFPEKILKRLENETGNGWIVNKPYSGTQILLDYGKEHEQTGKLIIYTSGDSVFQVAANKKIVPLNELYRYCETARKILNGENTVGRVIARPFVGDYPNYERTAERHDYSLVPPSKTILNYISEKGFDTICIGKISDIFASYGVTKRIATVSNEDGMIKTDEVLNDKSWEGLCFINLVDFDSKYGHRNDVDGYAKAISDFDTWLKSFIEKMDDNDYLIVTADHGCDPSTPSTDHSREYIPILCYKSGIKPAYIGIRNTFADIGKTILDVFNIENNLEGISFYDSIK